MKAMALVMLPISILLTAAVSQASDAVNPIPSVARYALQSAAQSPADTGFNGDVWAIGNYNGDLIIGGYFTTADGFPAIKIAGWDGASWFPMNFFPNGNPIYWIHEHNSLLYAGQALTQLCSWEGSSWTAHVPWLGTNFGGIWGLETYNNELIVCGGFENNAAQPSYIAKWNGAGWDTVGTGINNTVRVLDIFAGDLVAGGFFTTGDGSAGDRIAKWNGTTWSPLGTGMDGGVRALTTYNSELIAGGNYTTAGGNSASNIAKWNGSSWQALGDGLDGWVEALIVHDNKLIAGGRFANSGATPTASIASWDGSSWSAMGSGFDDDVYALGVFNGYLIAGGAFSDAGGYVALWDGATWRPVSEVTTDVDDVGAPTIPSGYSLDQNFPNPFNPTTSIEYSLPQPAHVTVDIYTVLGQRVRSLVDRQQTAGTHSVIWDGTNASGESVATGIYFYRIQAGEYAATKKMLLLK